MTWLEWIWPAAGVGGFLLGLFNLYLRFKDRVIDVHAEAYLEFFPERGGGRDPYEKIETFLPDKIKKLIKEDKCIPRTALKITNNGMSRIGVEEVGFGNSASGERACPWTGPKYYLAHGGERKFLPCYLEQKRQARVQSTKDLSQNSENLKKAEEGIYIKTTCGKIINAEVSDFKKNLDVIKNL